MQSEEVGFLYQATSYQKIPSILAMVPQSMAAAVCVQFTILVCFFQVCNRFTCNRFKKYVFIFQYFSPPTEAKRILTLGHLNLLLRAAH